MCVFFSRQAKGRVTLQTLQPSARVKGLVGSHGQVVHPTKEVLRTKKSNAGKVPTPPSTGKIHIFEDESSGMGHKKTPKTPKLEDRGVQTDTSELDDFTSLTSGKPFRNTFIIGNQQKFLLFV